MIQDDTTQLARFGRVGLRINGDRRLGSSPGAGFDKAHATSQHSTRLAYVDVLPDEQQATTASFLVRAVSWSNSQVITRRKVQSDIGGVYCTSQWQQACKALDLKIKLTSAYRHQVNGRPERFIMT